jgi:hypothetical protein
MRQNLTDKELALYKRVDEVLHYVWDPIGIATNAAAREEYVSYLPKIFAMLQERTDASSIAAYLDNVATERMGLGANPEHSKRVAELLLDCKAEVEKGRR